MACYIDHMVSWEVSSHQEEHSVFSTTTPTKTSLGQRLEYKVMTMLISLVNWNGRGILPQIVVIFQIRNLTKSAEGLKGAYACHLMATWLGFRQGIIMTFCSSTGWHVAPVLTQGTIQKLLTHQDLFLKLLCRVLFL